MKAVSLSKAIDKIVVAFLLRRLGDLQMAVWPIIEINFIMFSDRGE